MGLVLGSENAECEEHIFFVDYCFIARVVGGIGAPKLEEDEAISDTVAEWYDLDTAIRLIQAGEPTGFYVPILRGQRTIARELIFLREFALNFRSNCLY